MGRWREIKYFAFLMVAIMIVSMLSFVTPLRVNATTANHSQADAVNWATSQLNQSLDYDGVYGAQCVDLIKYYYAYLGNADYAYGNASAYVSNTLPTGWTRVYSDYQPGDIAVWKVNHSCSTCSTSSLGHVGIITSADSVGFNAVNQNFNSQSYCTQNWFYCSALQCAIRPDFSATSSGDSSNTSAWTASVSNLTETNATVSATFNVGSTVQFQWAGCNFFDANGNLIAQAGESTSVSNSYINIWYDINNETTQKLKLQAGTTYKYQFYATYGGVDHFSPVYTFTTPGGDNIKPVVSNVKVSNITKNGYKITCTVTDNKGVTKVKFPSWNNNIHQGENAIWLDGTISGSTATCTVNISGLKSGAIEGKYVTHIYAYDAAGNSACYVVAPIFIDRTAPVISNVSIENLTSEGYRVKCKIEDSGSGIDYVKFPTWTSAGGQDDLKQGWNQSGNVYQGIKDGDSWYFDVKTSEHNYETGIYSTNIYAWDMQGNMMSYCLSPCNNVVVPEAISDDEETNESDEELDNEDAEEPDEESDDEEPDEDSEDETDIEIGDIIEDTDDEIEYEVIEIGDGEYTLELIDYSGEETHVVIPNDLEVDGILYKITAIAKNAFKNNKTIKKVTIGNNVITICDSAFSGCKKLKTVVIGKNVKTIGSKAFLNCISLTKVTIPSKVTKIGSYAFKNCKKLTSITFGSSVKTIGKEALRGCSRLKQITIKSKKLKTVGKNAFKGIRSTARIKVPSSKLKAYKKLLKNKGQGKRVKIIK